MSSAEPWRGPVCTDRFATLPLKTCCIQAPPSKHHAVLETPFVRSSRTVFGAADTVLYPNALTLRCFPQAELMKRAVMAAVQDSSEQPIKPSVLAMPDLLVALRGAKIQGLG